MRKVQNSNIDKNRFVLQHREGKITDNYFEIHTTSSYTRYSWNDFIKHISEDSIVLLFTSNSQVIFLTERFFENRNDWFSFKQVVSEKVVNSTQYHKEIRTSWYQPKKLMTYILIGILASLILEIILSQK